MVEAFQLPPEDEDASDDLVDFLHKSPLLWEGERHGCIAIHTHERSIPARPGDWIIRDAQGTLDVCTPDAFEATYELVEM